MPFHFFREFQLATVLILIHDSYIIWSTRFILYVWDFPLLIPFGFY